MKVIKTDQYKNSKCECGALFVSHSFFQDKKCFCSVCKKDITKIICEKWKIIKYENGKTIKK